MTWFIEDIFSVETIDQGDSQAVRFLLLSGATLETTSRGRSPVDLARAANRLGFLALCLSRVLLCFAGVVTDWVNVFMVPVHSHDFGHVRVDSAWFLPDIISRVVWGSHDEVIAILNLRETPRWEDVLLEQANFWSLWRCSWILMPFFLMVGASWSWFVIYPFDLL